MTDDTERTLTLAPFMTVPKSARAALDEEGQALLRFVSPDATTFVVTL